MDLNFVEVKSREDVEWLRVKRNDPALFKYFRQDRPITPREQHDWWKNVTKSKIKLFIVHDKSLKTQDKRVGYAGFNPFDQYASRAEFGVFVTPEHQGKGYGTAIVKELLYRGFVRYRLSTIYSDVLMYPGEEKRWEFYKGLGFQPFPEPSQNIRYVKQGKTIPSLKFFMLREDYIAKYGEKHPGGLVANVKQAAGRVKEAIVGKG